MSIIKLKRLLLPPLSWHRHSLDNIPQSFYCNSSIASKHSWELSRSKNNETLKCTQLLLLLYLQRKKCFPFFISFDFIILSAFFYLTYVHVKSLTRWRKVILLYPPCFHQAKFSSNRYLSDFWLNEIEYVNVWRTEIKSDFL